MLDDDVHALATEANQAIFTTLMPGGEPQASIVWPHADRHHVLVTTSTGRQKYRNIARDPRATILLLDRSNSRRYIEVRGRVVAIEIGEAALDVARTTFTKWTGRPAVRPGVGDRVLLRLLPDRIHRKD
ncbi:TIGR03618 family F420-dependent PPOX class oxidoreductase [Rhodococcoides yunnanense]|uniref:TIGR03618 family F420-dependent PPOX class oxidoreductase n=1 Tax=Rhodococcoides yunnanense TaxID=278209 RepID=UPI0009329454|nr:TIGR03618 family F420-dependent PPOX class oxidoreductase [Rhodococcus yunnanensis]